MVLSNYQRYMNKEKIKFLTSKDVTQSSAAVILYSSKEVSNSCKFNFNPEKLSNNLISSKKDTSFFLYDKVNSLELKPAEEKIFFNDLIKEIEKLGLKRISLIGIQEAGSLASIMLAEKYPKLVRRLILLDPNVRKEPSMLCFILDKLESFLPCGLPLRNSKDNQIDLRGHIHRINCPSLVLSSKSASFFSKKSIRFLKKRLPNSWCLEFKEEMLQEDSTLCQKAEELIFSFLKTPSKRPQKILSEDESLLVLKEASGNYSD